ncbi:LysR substrate-binding domain-containing protein [Rhizobiaceae bacterium]|nr:LysR substrate-binding domain-containing protein [Rhizobiaceae bacterium]
MSIRLLRTLVTVSENDTFSLAGKALGVSHAAVSQQMKQLEAQWDVALFDRTSRTPRLTISGRALAAKARQVLTAYDGIVTSVTGEGSLQGELTLGAVPTTLTGLVPLAISKLRARFPDLHVRVVPGLTFDLMRELERGRLDAALATHPAMLPEAVVSSHIADEPLDLLLSPDIAPGSVADLLATHPFIRFSRDAVVGGMIESWLQASGIRVRETMELPNLDAILSMVMARLGISIAPRPCVRSPGQLAVVRMPLPPDAPVRTLSLMTRSDHAKVRVVEEVNEALLDAVQDGAFEPLTGRKTP